MGKPCGNQAGPHYITIRAPCGFPTWAPFSHSGSPISISCRDQTKLLNTLEKGSTLTCTKNNNPLTNNETVILDCSRHCFYLKSGLICFTLGSASSIFEGDFSQNMLLYSQELSKFFKSLHSVLLPIEK